MTSNHTHAAAFKTNFSEQASQTLTEPVAGSGGFLPARHVLDRYRISQMTLWRWVADDSMGFPKPVYLGRYRYWRIADIEAWEASQETRGAA